MCHSPATIDQVQYRMLHYQRLMREAVLIVDYNYYKDLWEITKANYRKMKAIG